MYVQVLYLGQDELHIFVQLNEVSIPWSLFALWNDDKQDLQVIQSDYNPTAEYPYFAIKPILLEEDLYGIIYDSSFRMTMTFEVLMYTEDNGYQKVFCTSSSWGGYSIDEVHPGRIIHRDYPSWDKSFPFSNMGYSTVDLYSILRIKEYTYDWDRDSLTFVKTDKKEIIREVGVVNHFLRELLEGNIASALDFVKEDSPLWKAMSKDDASDMPWILDSGDIYIVTIKDQELFPFDLPRANWNNIVSCVDTDRPTLAMVAAKPEVSRESDLEDILAIAIYEFTYKEPWKIVAIHYCELE